MTDWGFSEARSSEAAKPSGPRRYPIWTRTMGVPNCLARDDRTCGRYLARGGAVVKDSSGMRERAATMDLVIRDIKGLVLVDLPVYPKHDRQ